MLARINGHEENTRPDAVPDTTQFDRLPALVEDHPFGCVDYNSANLSCGVLLELNAFAGPISYPEGGPVVRS